MSLSNLNRKKKKKVHDFKSEETPQLYSYLRFVFFLGNSICPTMLGFFFFCLLATFVSVLQLLPALISSFVELGSTLLFMRN